MSKRDIINQKYLEQMSTILRKARKAQAMMTSPLS